MRRRWVAALVLLAALAWPLALRFGPPRVTATAPAGAHPFHYLPEEGPPAGLREQLIRSGQVPPDAIDDGRGRFVAPDSLTAAQRAAAAGLVARRARWRRPAQEGSDR